MTIDELEETLRQAHDYEEFYQELLDSYLVHVMEIGDNWERVIDIQAKHQEIEAKLPNVSDSEFEEYIILGDILAVLSEAAY